MPYDPQCMTTRLDPRVSGHTQYDAAHRRSSTPRVVSEMVGGRRIARRAGGGRSRKGFMEMGDDEDVAPSKGLRFALEDIVSSPDGNTIKLQIVRPDNEETVACVYYIHGGGMASMSSFYGNYRAWARIIAAKGVAVVMVEFRNSVAPSAVPEVAPYPGGPERLRLGTEMDRGQRVNVRHRPDADRRRRRKWWRQPDPWPRGEAEA